MAGGFLDGIKGWFGGGQAAPAQPMPDDITHKDALKEHLNRMAGEYESANDNNPKEHDAKLARALRAVAGDDALLEDFLKKGPFTVGLNSRNPAKGAVNLGALAQFVKERGEAKGDQHLQETAKSFQEIFLGTGSTTFASPKVDDKHKDGGMAGTLFNFLPLLLMMIPGVDMITGLLMAGIGILIMMATGAGKGLAKMFNLGPSASPSPTGLTLNPGVQPGVSISHPLTQAQVDVKPDIARSHKVSDKTVKINDKDYTVCVECKDDGSQSIFLLDAEKNVYRLKDAQGTFRGGIKEHNLLTMSKEDRDTLVEGLGSRLNSKTHPQRRTLERIPEQTLPTVPALIGTTVAPAAPGGTQSPPDMGPQLPRTTPAPDAPALPAVTDLIDPSKGYVFSMAEIEKELKKQGNSVPPDLKLVFDSIKSKRNDYASLGFTFIKLADGQTAIMASELAGDRSRLLTDKIELYVPINRGGQLRVERAYGEGDNSNLLFNTRAQGNETGIELDAAESRVGPRVISGTAGEYGTRILQEAANDLIGHRNWELARVPQILDMLGIDKKDHAVVLGNAKAWNMFAGEAAVKMDLVSREDLARELGRQAKLKAEAAENDRANLAEKDITLITPKWLKANWGNDGVNKLENPIAIDGASAAANIAQNIVMMANAKPELARDPIIAETVIAASRLTRGLGGEETLDEREAKRITERMKIGLYRAIAVSGITPKDRTGKEIDLDKFITARFKEIEAGVQQRLKAQQEAKQKQARQTAPAERPAATEYLNETVFSLNPDPRTAYLYRMAQLPPSMLQALEGVGRRFDDGDMTGMGAIWLPKQDGYDVFIIGRKEGDHRFTPLGSAVVKDGKAQPIARLDGSQVLNLTNGMVDDEQFEALARKTGGEAKTFISMMKAVGPALDSNTRNTLGNAWSKAKEFALGNLRGAVDRLDGANKVHDAASLEAALNRMQNNTQAQALKSQLGPTGTDTRYLLYRDDSDNLHLLPGTQSGNEFRTNRVLSGTSAEEAQGRAAMLKPLPDTQIELEDGKPSPNSRRILEERINSDGSVSERRTDMDVTFSQGHPNRHLPMNPDNLTIQLGGVSPV